MRHISLFEASQKSATVFEGLKDLTKPQTANKILPKDTVSALALQFIEKDESENFYGWYTGPLYYAAVYGVKPDGFLTGYISHNGKSLRIHKGEELIYDQPLSSVNISHEQKIGYVLHTGTKKYALNAGLPISNDKHLFASSGPKFGSPLQILFDELRTYGAQIAGPTAASNKKFLVGWFIFVGLASIALIIVVILSRP